MRNKKKYIITAAICIALIVAGTALFVIRNQGMDENAVTRYEWLEMLESRYGIEEYGSVPYFKDVDSDDPYFASVQSAVEWKIIDVASRFNGNQYASGEFVALTAIKTIGESKLRIYLDSEDALTDDTYIELAVEKGIIEKEQLTKGLSPEECEQVLENLDNLYFGEFWRDDYAKVTYQSDVVEMASADILQCNADCSEIMVTDNAGNSLEAGMIIVFEQGNTGLKIAREVTGISADGTVSLKPAELDQVVESLVVSDIAEVTLEDIARYNGWERIDSVAGNLGYQQTDARLISTAVFAGDIDSKGFKIAISVESDDDDEDEDTKSLEIEVTENDTGITYKLPIDVEVDSDDEFNVEIEIDKILVGAQASCSGFLDVEYADVAVDANAVLKGEIKMEQEEKIPLFNVSVPLAWGIAAVDVQLYLVMSLDGSISFGVELPVEMSLHYEKDKGLMNFSREAAFADPRIEVNCDASAMLGVGPTLKILGCDVIGVELETGTTANAKVTMRDNGQVCIDVSTAYPVVKISAELNVLVVSTEWEHEIITAENAPYQRGFHFEKLPDYTIQFVEECTYGKQTVAVSVGSQLGNQIAAAIILPKSSVTDEATEFAKYSTYEAPIGLYVYGPMEDSGDYYTIKGSLSIYYRIACEEFDQLDIGDSFTILDMHFVKKESFVLDGEGFVLGGYSLLLYPVYCTDDECEYYLSGSSSANWPYYDLYASASRPDDYQKWMQESKNIKIEWDISEFKIAKDALIMPYYFAREENRLTYTAEECFTDNIIIDGFSFVDFSIYNRELSDGESVFCYITFDKDGIIDSMGLVSFLTTPG